MSMETIVVSKEVSGLSNTETRQNSVRVNDYEPGKYLFIPMNHFDVDVEYNGKTFQSHRVLAFKLSDDAKSVMYICTWKTKYFTESLAGLKDDGMPEVKPKERNGRLRLPTNSVTYHFSTHSRLPKSVKTVVENGVEKKFLHIDDPFIIDFTGTLTGYTPLLVSANGVDWDVAVNEETGYARFDFARITQFEMSQMKPSTELVEAAKKMLKEDPQLRDIKVD